MRSMTMLLAAGIATTAVATTVYLDDGTAIDTSDNVYVSDGPLYEVVGSYKKGFTIKPVAPLKSAPPAGEPNCSDFTFGGERPAECPEPEPAPEECDSLTFGGGC